MSPRPDVSQERQEQILDAAEKVFSERGLSGTRMDDLVEESGLSKGALYWYYKSKDAVILALMERLLKRELSDAAVLVHSPGTAGERLQNLIRLVLSDLAGLGRLLPLAYEFVAMASRSKTFRRAISGYYEKYAALLSEIIQEGVDSGEFAELDVEQSALSVVALIEGLALIWFVAPDMVDMHSLGNGPLEAILDGFRKREH